MAPYKIRVIGRKEKERIFDSLPVSSLFQSKAEIHGACVKLFTDNPEFYKMWKVNFNPMDEKIRPHGRLFAVSEKYGKSGTVLFEPESSTAFIFGTDYYGQVKSIALAIVADYLEGSPSENRRYSIHGSFVDCGGKGVGIIGVSGSGKTTLTYGLMALPKYKFMTDDWFFVRLLPQKTPVFSSEKNSYVRGDLAEVWPQFASRIKLTRADSHGRSLVDVRRLFGEKRIVRESGLSAVVLLTREKNLLPFQRLAKKAALEFLAKNDFCNPHQLVRTKDRMLQREEFFSALFSRVPVYLINTIETPEKSATRLRAVFNC